MAALEFQCGTVIAGLSNVLRGCCSFLSRETLNRLERHVRKDEILYTSSFRSVNQNFALFDFLLRCCMCGIFTLRRFFQEASIVAPD